MANKSITEDFRTADAAGNIVIKTRDSVSQQVTNYYSGHDSVIHHHMIELEKHEFEPGHFYIGNDERHLSISQIETKHKCTCGYDLIPMEGGIKNPSIIQCQCEQCLIKVFVEIPYQKNIKQKDFD
jgi:hypothetical protein